MKSNGAMTSISPAAFAAGLILLTVTDASAFAASLPASDAQVTYSVVDQDLRDVLTEVVRQSGRRLNLSDAVHGRVQGRLAPAPLGPFLDRLARTYGLDWYFDGGAIWVSAASETTNKMLPLQSADPAQLEHTLDALAISDQRWPLRISPDAKVLIVDGPPRYLQLVEQTIDELGRGSGAVSHVSVFRGSVGGP